jgi:hypothetical protein
LNQRAIHVASGIRVLVAGLLGFFAGVAVTVSYVSVSRKADLMDGSGRFVMVDNRFCGGDLDLWRSEGIHWRPNGCDDSLLDADEREIEVECRASSMRGSPDWSKSAGR